MIPRKIPTRDFTSEYAAATERRFDPTTLRPGFVPPAHPEAEQKTPEAPAADVPLPEELNKKSEESLKRESVDGRDVSEAHATENLDGGA